MTAWSKCRSCNGACSFLQLTSQVFATIDPFVFLAALDMGQLDLADLLASICMGDCKWLDNGELWYTIKHLYKSSPSSFCFMK